MVVYSEIEHSIYHNRIPLGREINQFPFRRKSINSRRCVCAIPYKATAILFYFIKNSWRIETIVTHSWDDVDERKKEFSFIYFPFS